MNDTVKIDYDPSTPVSKEKEEAGGFKTLTPIFIS